jgi:hypothetical protein
MNCGRLRLICEQPGVKRPDMAELVIMMNGMGRIMKVVAACAS